jgi:hypothetical protein
VVPPDLIGGFESTYTRHVFAILQVSTSPAFTKFSLFGPTGGGGGGIVVFAGTVSSMS